MIMLCYNPRKSGLDKPEITPCPLFDRLQSRENVAEYPKMVLTSCRSLQVYRDAVAIEVTTTSCVHELICSVDNLRRTSRESSAFRLREEVCPANSACGER